MALLILLPGCSDTNPVGTQTDYDLTEDILLLREAGESLTRAVDAFLQKPGDPTVQALRSTWQRTHERYLTFAMTADVSPDEHANLDAWPIAPGFIDVLPEYPETGIVGDATLVIDVPTLRGQHQFSDSIEVSVGFHVIEYLAFGRPISDFMGESDGVERRRRLLHAATRALGEDLSALMTRLETTGAVADTHAMLLRCQQAVANMDSDLKGEPGDRHGATSNSVVHLMSVQSEQLYRLLFETTMLGDEISKADDKLASDIEHAATEISETLKSGRLPAQPLLSGLDHLLRDASLLLGTPPMPDQDRGQP